MWYCDACHAKNYESAKFCRDCGIEKPKYADNYCTNPKCSNHRVAFSDPQLCECDKCHSITTYWKTISDLI